MFLRIINWIIDTIESSAVLTVKGLIFLATSYSIVNAVVKAYLFFFPITESKTSYITLSVGSNEGE